MYEVSCNVIAVSVVELCVQFKATGCVAPRVRPSIPVLLATVIDFVDQLQSSQL